AAGVRLAREAKCMVAELLPAITTGAVNPPGHFALGVSLAGLFAKYGRCTSHNGMLRSASNAKTRSALPAKINISLNPRYVMRLPFTIGGVRELSPLDRLSV